jgi:hypothetical protein
MKHPLWRENGSVIYNCCWPSPAQSFSGPSLAGLMTVFYGLRFKNLPIWRARSPSLYSPGTGWPGYTPRHWVPLSSPPMTSRATVEVFEPASTRGTERVENAASQLLHHCVLRICCLATGVFSKPFPSNGCLCWLRSSCLEQICHNILSFHELLSFKVRF